MMHDPLWQVARDRQEDRRRQAERRRAARRLRRTAAPVRARAGLWLIRAGVALTEQARRARPEWRSTGDLRT